LHLIGDQQFYILPAANRVTVASFEQKNHISTNFAFVNLIFSIPMRLPLLFFFASLIDDDRGGCFLKLSPASFSSDAVCPHTLV
jgi:hypothetical protein